MSYRPSMSIRYKVFFNIKKELVNSDIEYIQKVYPNTYFGYHHMTTFFSLPLINTRYFQSILKVFDRFDNMLIDRIPSVGKYCWITIIKIKKSK